MKRQTTDQSLHAAEGEREQLTFGKSASKRLGRGAKGWDGMREAGRRQYVSLRGGIPKRAGLLLSKHTSSSVSWKNIKSITYLSITNTCPFSNALHVRSSSRMSAG